MLAKPSPRIASLLASSTELVVALGAGDALVCRSHECDYPPWVTSLPQASRPTFDTSLPSAQIDAIVRRKLAAKEPLFVVDDALVASLKPDVILTQTHCEVCAVHPDNIGDWAACTRTVTALRAGTIAGILDGFEHVGAAIGRTEEAARLIADIHGELNSVAAKLQGQRRPTIVCCEWLDPLFAFGNWGPEIIACAGGESLIGEVGKWSAAMDWRAVVDADPEFLLFAPCGFSVARTLKEMPEVAKLPGWGTLRAVRGNNVVVADGNLYFNRSSPTLFKSVNLLAEVLHPDVFPRQYGSEWWQRWSV